MAWRLNADMFHATKAPTRCNANGTCPGETTMSDNEDWRRRKAEELGLIDTGPWLSRPLRQPAPAAEAAPSRAPQPSAVRPQAQSSAADRDPPPIRTLSDIPDDAIHVDRRQRTRPGTPPGQSAASPSVSLRGDARQRWRARAAIVIAIAAGLALAVVLGWWLRGAAAPADIPLVIPTTVAPSSGAAAPAAGPAQTPSDAFAAGGSQAATMAESVPEPAPASSPSVANSPPADFAPATVAVSPTASPPAASSPRAERSPAVAQYAAEKRARVPVTTGEGPASHAERQSEPRARLSASRGRFTAPRAVAALGRDFSPSFNCRRATSWVNRVVCNDKELAALDVRMSDAYGDAVTAAGPAGERRIDTDQARFLAQRARCRNAACVDRAYRIRIEELALPN